jgi:hypothetical protein
MEVALEALERAGSEGRRQTILILSDGYPTAPGSAETAAGEALKQAERARARGVRVYTLGLGIEEAADDDVYALIARNTGGEYRRLTAPGEVVRELPRIDLADVAGVRIENLTSGEPGQAVRVFPDGSFDGYVKLVAGENLLRVTAQGGEGGTASVDRTVHFAPREPADEEEARAFDAEVEAFKAKLGVRALETELAEEARRAREDHEEQRRELDVRAGPDEE